jgi:hypothetical protein
MIQLSSKQVPASGKEIRIMEFEKNVISISFTVWNPEFEISKT